MHQKIPESPSRASAPGAMDPLSFERQIRAAEFPVGEFLPSASCALPDRFFHDQRAVTSTGHELHLMTWSHTEN